MKYLKRRRAEQKTDYMRRMGMLKSGVPRVVFRRTNRYVVAQYIESHEAKDKILEGVTSKNLLDYGWPKEMENSLKSMSAAYLTGFLIGKRIVKGGKGSILDIGMIKAIKGGKVFAFLKGLKDSGVNINVDKENFPENSRVEGKHMKKDFTKKFEEIKSKIEKEK